MNYPEWVSRIIYLEKRPQIAVLAAIALLVLISFTNQALTLHKLLRSTSSAAQAMLSTQPKPIPKIIAGVALFGNATSQTAVVNLPTTNLQLILRGAVVENNPAKSSAVIEEPSKPAASYKVGDVLPGNATLSEVFADHVVLNRNGQLETLNFPAQNTLDIQHVENVTASNGVPTLNTPPKSIKERLLELQRQHEQR